MLLQFFTTYILQLTNSTNTGRATLLVKALSQYDIILWWGRNRIVIVADSPGKYDGGYQ